MKDILEAVRLASSGEVSEQLFSESLVNDLVNQYETAMYDSLSGMSLADLLQQENSVENPA